MFLQQEWPVSTCKDAQHALWVESCPPKPGGSMVKNPPANVGATRDFSSIPGSGRSPKVGSGHFTREDTLRLKTEKWKNTCHGANTNYQKARMAILIPRKENFKTRKVIKGKDEHFIRIKDNSSKRQKQS